MRTRQVKKFLLGLVLGGVIGFGGANLADNYNDVVIEPIQTVFEEQGPRFQVSVNSDQLEALIQDGRAAPCYCRHVEYGAELWCGHDNLYCDEMAAEQCEKDNQGYRCAAGLSLNFRPDL